MRRDLTRTVLVVAELPHLWAAVQEHLDPELALVRHARPEQLEEVWHRADPWPWIVVGASRPVPRALSRLVSNKPVPVWWLGRPAGLPETAVCLQTWDQLAARLDGVRRPIFGMHLAPRRGVRVESRHYTRDAIELEGLMAAHPGGLPTFDTLRRVRTAIARHDLPCQVKQVSGRVTLQPRGLTQS